MSHLRLGDTRIWQTYYEPKPLNELYTGWQEMLAEYRQIIEEVQEIAEETGWRGPQRRDRVPVKSDRLSIFFVHQDGGRDLLVLQ